MCAKYHSFCEKCFAFSLNYIEFGSSRLVSDNRWFSPPPLALLAEKNGVTRDERRERKEGRGKEEVGDN